MYTLSSYFCITTNDKRGVSLPEVTATIAIVAILTVVFGNLASYAYQKYQRIEAKAFLYDAVYQSIETIKEGIPANVNLNQIQVRKILSLQNARSVTLLDGVGSQFERAEILIEGPATGGNDETPAWTFRVYQDSRKQLLYDIQTRYQQDYYQKLLPTESSSPLAFFRKSKLTQSNKNFNPTGIEVMQFVVDEVRDEFGEPYEPAGLFSISLSASDKYGNEVTYQDYVWSPNLTKKTRGNHE